MHSERIFHLLVERRRALRKVHYDATLAAAKATAAFNAHDKYENELGMGIRSSALSKDRERAYERLASAKTDLDIWEAAVDWYALTFMGEAQK